jgi:SAM-dependent methyltransferase
MIYGDNPNIDQSDYDWYYINKYGYGVADEQCRQRLIDRSKYIVEHFGREVRVMDFGGGDSGLVSILENMDFDDTMTLYNVGCGDEIPGDCDVVIAEHVLEHVYDMKDAMSKITRALRSGGTLIVDVPDAGGMAFEQPARMPILDFTQVHINHFRMIDMLKLMQNYGFELKETIPYHERFGSCRMYVFLKDITFVSRESRHFITQNIRAKTEKLKELKDKPVAVWGCGDIALHCLTKQSVNVQYFIDSDPAYNNQKIGGIPIYKIPIDNISILVIAQSQRDSIIENIKRLNLTNEVIVI